MKYVFTALGLFSTTACPAQSQPPPLQIRSMIVYQDTARGAYSTGGALGHFQILKARNVPAISVSAANTDRLSQVLTRAENRKHHQTKLGNRLIFAEIKFGTDTNVVHRMIFSGTGETTKMFSGRFQTQAVLTDLSAMRNYIITDASDLKWLDSLRKGIVGQQN